MSKDVEVDAGSAPVAPGDTDSPCGQWITAADVERLTGCSDVDPDDPMVGIASDVLFKLSGERFSGICTTTVNPGVYCGCAEPRSSCFCEGVRYLQLGAHNVRDVVEVRLDGEVLAPSEYRLHGSRLYRLPDAFNRRQVWPCCQRPDQVPDERIEVDYTYGEPPPGAGLLAAAILACELMRAKPDGTPGECRLPKRVQMLTYQGVTVPMLDPMSFLEDGRTGIYEVDLFLSAYVSSGGARRSGMVNPDTVRARRAQ